MGILSGLMGNASEVSVQEVQTECAPLLIESEEVEKAYRLVRDLFVFTNKRLILIDKQGYTGNKVEYLSIPYNAISHFATETAGHFDLDAELKIWIRGENGPLVKQFKKGSNIESVQKAIAYYVLK
jgi:hypothetical protein